MLHIFFCWNENKFRPQPRREENQPDVTEFFISLMIRSTCFGHFYAHHQELETICVLLPPMVCSDMEGLKRPHLFFTRLHYKNLYVLYSDTTETNFCNVIELKINVVF